VSCSQCVAIEDTFDDDLSASELRRFQRRGPRITTRALVEKITALGVNDRTVLDIGGGVGAAHISLLAAGALSAVDVDASAAYITTAKREAKRRGYASRVSHLHGNFVDLAPDVPAADIVTLDKVICCYDDARNLLKASAKKARSILGIVHPSDTWLSRLINRAFNFGKKIQGNDFRTFVHPQSQIDSIIQSAGLEKTARVTRGFWQIAIYTRKKSARTRAAR